MNVIRILRVTTGQTSRENKLIVFKSMVDFITKNWQGFVAGLALLTSVISNIIAYYTFKLQRTHNIKSVKPILQIGQWDYENNLIVDLRNSGTGVAIITNTVVSNKLGKVENCIYDWLPKKLPGSMNYKEYWVRGKDYVVQSGQIYKIVEIPIDDSNEVQKKEREKIRAILRQLTVKISYEDIYGNKMPDKEIELFYFSRTDNEN